MSKQIEMVILRPKWPGAKFVHEFDSGMRNGVFIDEFKFSTGAWNLEVKYKPDTAFDKVAAIVGDNVLAKRVVEALEL
jgi:hypothetical protein